MQFHNPQTDNIGQGRICCSGRSRDSADGWNDNGKSCFDNLIHCKGFRLGGSSTCSVTVTVTPTATDMPPPPICPSPPPPAAKVIDRLTIHVNFDFDKSDIRKADMAELKKASDFVRKYRGAKVKLEGHTDSKGTEEYNQKLSERRAEAVRQYLIKEGAVEKAMISATGYGELRPIAPNKTKDGKDNPEGRAENRRVEILIISE